METTNTSEFIDFSKLFDSSCDDSMIHFIHTIQNRFKRTSLTRMHQFNNLLVYYISHFVEVYAKKFTKKANKIVRFLSVSEMKYEGNKIYSYNKKTQTMIYKLPGDVEDTVLDNVKNLESDFQRRQVNILIIWAQHFNFFIEYTRSILRKSQIEKNKISVITFEDDDHKQHTISLDNLDDYYEDVANELNNQIERIPKDIKEFLIENKIFVYNHHPNEKKETDKLKLDQENKNEKLSNDKNNLNETNDINQEMKLNEEEMDDLLEFTSVDFELLKICEEEDFQ